MIRVVVAASCAALAIGLFTGCACCAKQGKKMAKQDKMAMMPCVQVCPDCHVVAMKGAKCPMCQKAMSAKHVLGIKDGSAMLCDCGAGCKCDAMGIKDGKCACGKEVKTMSAKGMYVCAMGCPEISDKPGKCMCGKELELVK